MRAGYDSFAPLVLAACHQRERMGNIDSDAYVGEDRQPLSHSSAVLEPGSQVNKGSGTVAIEQAPAPSPEEGLLYVKPTVRL